MSGFGRFPLDMAELEIRTHAMTLQGLQWGKLDREDQPKVLALHGRLDNAASFSGLAPLLAKEGYHVVAPDLPGHGRSPERCSQ